MADQTPTLQELLAALEEAGATCANLACGLTIYAQPREEDLALFSAASKHLRWLASALPGMIEAAALIDFLSAWTKGDQTIIPPGQHGGKTTHWLFAREDVNDPRHSSYGIVADEWEAPTLHEALSAARSSTGEKHG